jgi:TRAP-type C4-dicarboxylate transport system substrate-binding protein
MFKNARRVVGGVCSAALLAATAVPAGAETFKLKIGAGHVPAGLWVQTIRDFYMPRLAERVEKETGHKIDWTPGWGGSLCKIGECLEAVESGLLDMADVHAPTEPAKLLAHNFTFFAPFGSPDPRVVAKAVGEIYQKVPQLKKVLEDKYSQMYVGAGVVGSYGLITNFKWDKVSELKGRKIAAIGPNFAWLQGTGAVPVQSNLNEAYTSMQSGVYEGWVMLAEPIVSFKLNEVSKQFLEMDFGAIHTPLLTMNKDSFKALPANVQKIVLEVGAEFTARMGEVTWQKQVESVAKLKELGIDVRPATPDMRVEYAKQLANVPKVRFEEINKAGMPGEVIYEYIKTLKAAGHTFPRDWAAER